MNRKPTILIALTSHDQLGNTGRKTGYYLSEVSHPYAVFNEFGFDVEFVSVAGGDAPMDGVNRNDEVNAAFLDNTGLMAQVQNTPTPDQVNGSDYAGLLFAGGHGTMWDFAESEGLANIARDVYETGGVIGAVCHGVAGLLNIELSNGRPLVDGKTLTSFTNEEEEAVNLTDVVPYLLETELIAKGAIHTKAPNFKAHVESSERVVTGQNPASAAGVAQGMVDAINA